MKRIDDIARDALQSIWRNRKKQGSRSGAETGSPRTTVTAGGDGRRGTVGKLRDEREPSPNWDPVIRPGPVRAAPVGASKK